MAKGAQVFQADLNRLLLGYQDKLDAIVRQSVQEIAERVVVRTPVDTSFARNSWWTGVDGSKPTHPSPPSPGTAGQKGSAGGAPAIDGLDAVNAPGHVWQLRNNARYIRRLELGHSKQSPAGMVRITLAETKSIVSQMAKAVKATPR